MNTRKALLALLLPLLVLAGCRDRDLPTVVQAPGLPAFSSHGTDGPLLYLVEAGRQRLAVLRSSDYSLVTSFPLLREPYDVAITPDGIRAYVTHRGEDDYLSVFNISDNSSGSIPVGPGAQRVAVTPDGTRAYVTLHLVEYDWIEVNGHVKVINTSTNSVIGAIELEGTPLGVAVTPDGTRVYVANGQLSSVSVINTASDEVIAILPLLSAPSEVAITLDGRRAYVTHGGDRISMIDTDPGSPTYHSVLTTFSVGSSAERLAIAPDGTRAYVTHNALAGAVSAIDTDPHSSAYNSVLTVISVGMYPFDVAITPDGTRVYVTHDEISVINTSTNLVEGTVPQYGARGIAIGPAPRSTHTFGGFRPPVREGQLNVVKAGRAVPVKFSLGGDFGLEIFAAGYPTSVPIACPAAGVARNTVGGTTSARASRLIYDAAADQYNYLWVTQKAWAGTCRRFEVQFVGDTNTYPLDFSFTR